MKKILFSTDFSKTSHNAFAYACKLAEKLDASLDVITIFHLPSADVADLPPDYFPRLIEEQKEMLSEKMAAFIATQNCIQINKSEVIYGMFIPQEITCFARNNKHDLIVMGTKGQHDVFEKVLGSITIHTMMQASCPVLAIPVTAVFEPITKIAYATDFSLNDVHSVEKLAEISKSLDADTLFVHVETAGEIGKVGDIIEINNYPYEYADFSVINSASVLEGLDTYMKEKEINWLSLFIPRRRLWERLFHSSFSKKMLFHSDKPLLIFHE